MSNVKKRNWATIVYLENHESKDWIETLKLRGLSCAISPLHDKDINPTGEPKKAHYHVIMTFGNPTTYNNVKQICDDIGAKMPIPLDSVVGYYRYLTHKDNPEKSQYDESEIIHLNGFDSVELMTDTEITCLLKQIVLIIKLNNICEFDDLVDYLMQHDMHDHLVSLQKHPYFVSLYLKSKRFKHLDNFR